MNEAKKKYIQDKAMSEMKFQPNIHKNKKYLVQKDFNERNNEFLNKFFK